MNSKPTRQIEFEHLSSVVLIAGVSGAGKSTASNILADLGFYTIDNLPLGLLPQFAELTRSSSERFNRCCLLLDIYAGDSLEKFLTSLPQLKESTVVHLIFLDSSTPALIQRYSETRRPHPAFRAERDQSLTDTIDWERGRLCALRDRANYVIDTSKFNIHDLKRELTTIVQEFDSEVVRAVRVNFLSFGFKHGTPFDCDLIVDVRFLPNPHFVDELRDSTGLTENVYDFVVETSDAQEFMNSYVSLLNFLLPRYAHEGKAYINIGVGCTGGQHRSVAIARALAQMIDSGDYLVSVKHRDIVE